MTKHDARSDQGWSLPGFLNQRCILDSNLPVDGTSTRCDCTQVSSVSVRACTGSDLEVAPLGVHSSMHGSECVELAIPDSTVTMAQMFSMRFKSGEFAGQSSGILVCPPVAESKPC